MATGDPRDIAARLARWLPARWFADTGSVLTAVLAGFASGLSLTNGMVRYAALQVRIATASDGFLDLISGDFFGGRMPRGFAETDASFRTRIQAEIFRPRGTRAAVVKALRDLTGRPPVIFEPSRPADTGAYNVGASLGYGTAGAYGSLALPDQSFVVAFRPIGVPGLPNVAPYGVVNGVGAGAVGRAGVSPGSVVGGTAEYANLDDVPGTVTDTEIYAAINSVRAAGTVIWVRVSN